MSEHEISDIDYADALARGRAEAVTEMRARAVRYLVDRDVLEIQTIRSGGFWIPRARVTALQDMSPEELSQLEVWPDGSAIELKARDIQISVDSLLTTGLLELRGDQFG